MPRVAETARNAFEREKQCFGNLEKSDEAQYVEQNARKKYWHG